MILLKDTFFVIGEQIDFGLMICERNFIPFYSCCLFGIFLGDAEAEFALQAAFGEVENEEIGRCQR